MPTLKVYVYSELDYDKKPRFTVASSDMTNYGYALVDQFELEWEPPAAFNPIKAETLRLHNQLEQLNKEYAERVTKVEDKIRNLLALEAPV